MPSATPFYEHALSYPHVPVFRERARRPAAGGDDPAKPPSLNVPIGVQLKKGRVLGVRGSVRYGVWRLRDQGCVRLNPKIG